MTKLLVLAIAIAGCKEKSKLDTPPPTSTKPTAGSAAGSAAATPVETEARAFCEKTMQKVLSCFNDTGFWDVFATTYFAKYPDTTGNPDAKVLWIGMRKDDIAGLKKEGQLEANCGVMVRTSQLPTPADMQPVVEAMGKSCTDFGTAMGFMLFHKGVFHTPRT